MALDGNSRWCYLDPKLGAMHALAEAARNVACSGATPVGATNCLNFGNPEKPDARWFCCGALKRAMRRMLRLSLDRPSMRRQSWVSCGGFLRCWSWMVKLDCRGRLLN